MILHPSKNVIVYSLVIILFPPDLILAAEIGSKLDSALHKVESLEIVAPEEPEGIVVQVLNSGVVDAAGDVLR